MLHAEERVFESRLSQADADGMFDAADTDGNGEISTSELRVHLGDIGYTDVAADAVFQSLDADGSGEISRGELRAGFLKYS